MVRSVATLTHTTTYKWGAITLFSAIAIILLALGFEHIGGYTPCSLCLQQRYAYYAGIPLLFFALILFSANRHALATALFVLVACAFLANAGLGIYHAGVEWKYWEGPATCSGGLQALSTTQGSLLQDLATKPVPLCGEAQLRIFGLSFAGWNAIASLGLMFGAIRAALSNKLPQ